MVLPLKSRKKNLNNLNRNKITSHFGKAKTLLGIMPHEENVSEAMCFTLSCRKTQGLSYCQDSSFCIIRRLVQNFTSNVRLMLSNWYTKFGWKKCISFFYVLYACIFSWATITSCLLRPLETSLPCSFSTLLFHTALPHSFSSPMSVPHQWQKGIEWLFCAIPTSISMFYM